VIQKVHLDQSSLELPMDFLRGESKYCILNDKQKSLWDEWAD